MVDDQGRRDHLDQRVGLLEQSMAQVVTTLTAFKGTLEEIKQGITTARPTFLTLAPILLTAISIIIAGVLAVSSIQTELARIAALTVAAEGRVGRLEDAVTKLNDDRNSELVKERDFLKGRLYGQDRSKWPSADSGQNR